MAACGRTNWKAISDKSRMHKRKSRWAHNFKPVSYQTPTTYDPNRWSEPIGGNLIYVPIAVCAWAGHTAPTFPNWVFPRRARLTGTHVTCWSYIFWLIEQKQSDWSGVQSYYPSWNQLSQTTTNHDWACPIGPTTLDLIQLEATAWAVIPTL